MPKTTSGIRQDQIPFELEGPHHVTDDLGRHIRIHMGDVVRALVAGLDARAAAQAVLRASESGRDPSQRR
jgi:hypothetical protein